MIARTVYKQTVQPGKFVKTWNYMTSNFLYAYIPSLAFSVPVAVILFFLHSPNECSLTTDSDSIFFILIYLLAFILPNLLATLFNIVFLTLYLRTEYVVFNRFMVFPIIQIVFGVFYLAFRIAEWAMDWEVGFGEWVYYAKTVVELMAFVGLVVGRFTRESSSETHTLITERKPTMERSQGEF